MHLVQRMRRCTVIVLLLGQAVLLGCTVKNVPPRPVMTLPVIEQTDALGIRVIARTLAPLSVAVTVYLVAKAAMPDVRVSIEASGSVLTVTPKVCHLYVLSPPSVRHADYPPYPAPVVPLCSFVISAKASGTYPATLRIKDSAGNDLVMPTSLAVVIKGESP